MTSLCVATMASLVGCGGDDDDGDAADAPPASAATPSPTEVESTTTDAPTTDGPATTAPSSDAPSTDAPSTDAPSTDVPAPTGTPITLMVTGRIQSTIGSFAQGIDGAEAAAAGINAQGGIGGHPIEIVTCSDEGEAALAAQCAQEAVDTDVTAVVGGLLLDPGYFPILEAAGIPMVGGTAALPQEVASPLAYPLHSGGIGQFSAIGGWLAANVGSNIAILTADSPTGIFLSQTIKQTAEAGGATASEVRAPAGAPDFSSFASNLVASNPDVVVLTLVPIDVVPAVQALRAQGFEGPVANIRSTFGNDVVEALGDAADGALTFSSWAMPEVTESELMDRFNAEMDEHAPDAVRDEYSQAAWSAVNVVAWALEGSESVDAAAVIAGLDALEVDLVGMVGAQPFSFTAADSVSPERPRIFNPDVAVYRIEAGEYELIQDFFDPTTDPSGAAAG